MIRREAKKLRLLPDTKEYNVVYDVQLGEW